MSEMLGMGDSIGFPLRFHRLTYSNEQPGPRRMCDSHCDIPHYS